MILTDEQRTTFEEAGRPLIKWLNDNFHPHVTVIVDPTGMEIFEAACFIPITDYIKD